MTELLDLAWLELLLDPSLELRMTFFDELLGFAMLELDGLMLEEDCVELDELFTSLRELDELEAIFVEEDSGSSPE